MQSRQDPPQVDEAIMVDPPSRRGSVIGALRVAGAQDNDGYRDDDATVRTPRRGPPALQNRLAST